MSLTKAQLTALRAVVASVPARLGMMRQVLGHEPKNQPGRGITTSVFLNRIDPITSGLNSTSARITWYVRLQTPMLSDPEDEIDMDLGAAALAVMEGYAGGFSLTGLDAAGIDVRTIDIRGMEGVKMDGGFGYFEHDGVEYRVCLLNVPILVNDVLPEVA